MIRSLSRATLALTLVLAAGGAAAADEAKTPLSAVMLLNIVNAPVERRASAFDESLKRPAPPVEDSTEGQLQVDGSVRYGRTTITVKNPCPPGTAHWEPPPLPGRRPVPLR